MISSLSPVTDPLRLAALRRTGLTEATQEPAFDRLTRLAARFLGVPVVFVSLVDAESQFFKSCVGLPKELESVREIPLTHSLCTHVVTSNAPLIVGDARRDLLLYDNRAVTDFHVVAYAGFPLTTSEGFVLGAFAAVDYKPRVWTRDDIALLTELTKATMVEIELRMQHALLASEVQHEHAERMRIEDALHQAQHRYQAVTEAALDAIVSETEDGIILTWNAAAERMFGYHAHEVIGQRHSMLLPPEQRHATKEEIQSIIGQTVEAVGLRKDGTRFPLEVSLGSWNEGRECFHSVVMRDLTQRHQVEVELSARATLLRSAFYDAAIGMALVGLDGKWLQVNAAVSEIVGYSNEELLRIDFQTITHPDDLDADLALLHQLLNGTIRFYQMEKRYRHKDGRTVWVLLNVSLVRDNRGRPLHCISQIQDITARKQALHDLELARVAAEQGNRAKSQFMATMSHEFRTPLHAIAGMTELLLETNLNDQQKLYAATVRDAGQALGRILSDILDFVTIEQETLALTEAPFDPRAMVEQVASVVRPACLAKGVDLSVTVAPQVPGSLFGDQGRVHQILLSLIGNAVKFTERGHIHVNVKASTLSPSQALVEFDVQDTGIGMHEDVRSRLFQPFTQADGSWSRRFGGLGLQLALTQRLTELMQGSIAVRSTEGSGSTFTVQIPFRIAQMTGATSVALSATAHDPCAPRVILVAEDNPVNQRLVLLQLRKLGYDAEAVNDGAAAVEAVQHGSYGLVLMDCQMPGMDGLSATRAIREMEQGMPGMRHLPIVALTANAMEGDREICLTAGMDDYVSKPIKVDVLDDVIKRWLSGGCP